MYGIHSVTGQYARAWNYSQMNSSFDNKKIPNGVNKLHRINITNHICYLGYLPFKL